MPNIFDAPYKKSKDEHIFQSLHTISIKNFRFQILKHDTGKPKITHPYRHAIH